MVSLCVLGWSEWPHARLMVLVHRLMILV